MILNLDEEEVLAACRFYIEQKVIRTPNLPPPHPNYLITDVSIGAPSPLEVQIMVENSPEEDRAPEDASG